MITYLGKCLPHLSDVTEPLRRLLDRDVEWHWDDAHEAALNQVKQPITREPVLRYFDNTKEVTLQCDAPESDLGSVIMQEAQTVAFSSRALNSEKNYAQIEKELLSIVHGCIRFDQYVYGREITVQTDHKPLENILKRPLLQTPRRLQQMLLQLQKRSVQTRKGTFNRRYTQSCLSSQ